MVFQRRICFARFCSPEKREESELIFEFPRKTPRVLKWASELKTKAEASALARGMTRKKVLNAHFRALRASTRADKMPPWMRMMWCREGEGKRTLIKTFCRSHSENSPLHIKYYDLISCSGEYFTARLKVEIIVRNLKLNLNSESFCINRKFTNLGEILAPRRLLPLPSFRSVRSLAYSNENNYFNFRRDKGLFITVLVLQARKTVVG